MVMVAQEKKLSGIYMIQETDILIIGAGIIGLNIALALRQKHPSKTITIIDKEKNSVSHASGRNSGVLHAGFYYTPDTLKAKFTKEGNALLTKFCEKHKLKINKCGKLVVASNEKELQILYKLEKRAKINNIPISLIHKEEAQKIEPNVITYKKALWSPTTSSVNPCEIVNKFVKIALLKKINIIYNCKYLKKLSKNSIYTSNGTLKFDFLINSAGLYADKIAKDFGLSRNYNIIPFKGIYLYAKASKHHPKTHIYPVPDLKFPFLGVHYTITTDNIAKIGPTSIPAFWRENYQGFQNFNIGEMFKILTQETRLFINNRFNFRSLAINEIKKYYKPHLKRKAEIMYSKTNKLDLSNWGKTGIRAQLYDTEKQALEMDFKHDENENSFHILNAVSPAFTCSIPFSKYVANIISQKL